MTDLQKMIVLPAAFLAFLYSAQFGGGMSWRAQESAVVAATR
jgi:predicted metalloprotease